MGNIFTLLYVVVIYALTISPMLLSYYSYKKFRDKVFPGYIKKTEKLFTFDLFYWALGFSILIEILALWLIINVALANMNSEGPHHLSADLLRNALISFVFGMMANLFNSFYLSNAFLFIRKRAIRKKIPTPLIASLYPMLIAPYFIIYELLEKERAKRLAK